jgi:hypothetical protein
MLPSDPPTYSPEPAAAIVAAESPRFTSAKRVVWLKGVVAAGLAAGLLLSAPLWIGPRSFPFAPAFAAAAAIPTWVEMPAFLLLLSALAVTLLARSAGWAILLVLVVAAVLASRDQMRWQPWFYQYAFMLAALGFCSPVAHDEKREALLNTCRLIVASIYFYSGLQKLNPAFVNDVLPWMFQPIAKAFPLPLHLIPVSSGFIIAFLEMGIGVGLLTNKFRLAAIALALLMCAFVLATIGPLGHNWNSVVWPWNVAMVLFVFILFAGVESVSFRDVFWIRNSIFHKVVLLLFAIMPVFSFVNWWDGYLSSNLYSGNTTRAQMFLSAALIERLPGEIRHHVTTEKSGQSALDIFRWSYDELNVPPYPEPRVYREITRAICRYAEDDLDVIVVVRAKRALLSSRVEAIYDCWDLNDP